MRFIQSIKNFLWIVLLSMLSLLGGCKSEHRVESDLKLESYIHRIYIQLYGRKATESEQIMGKIFLCFVPESAKWRRIYCDQLIRSEEFRLNQYNIARSDLLNFIFNPDSASIQETIEVWKKMYPDSIWQPEVKRLKRLQQIPGLLRSGMMTYEELQKTLIHNSYYDFINMGSENFVVSLYHNFLERPPTAHELKTGIILTDGNCAYFANTLICGKAEYIQAFFDQNEFAEGQARKLVRMILYRDIKPSEIQFLTNDFLQFRDHSRIWSRLLSSDEFMNL